MENTQFRFEPISALDLINRAPERIPCLVEDLLPKVGMSMLCAKPKTGKSCFARQLSVAVAGGRKFLGRDVQPGNVLYMNLEGQTNVLGAHFRQLGYTESQGK